MSQKKSDNKLKNIDPKLIVLSLAILIAVVVGFSYWECSKDKFFLC